ncbi:hypothetical protein, partial [Eisenbergiella porci]|uniref:hypothetical protein n=1 Tax=Eisenbergiella porci TaxID=2652274 RepID=UPI002A82DA78
HLFPPYFRPDTSFYHVWEQFTTKFHFAVYFGIHICYPVTDRQSVYYFGEELLNENCKGSRRTQK